MNEFIEKLEKDGCFINLEDGLLYFDCPSKGGAFNSDNLRNIADYLDEINYPPVYYEKTDHYYPTGSPFFHKPCEHEYQETVYFLGKQFGVKQCVDCRAFIDNNKIYESEQVNFEVEERDNDWFDGDVISG